jgi:hypothetical protein
METTQRNGALQRDVRHAVELGEHVQNEVRRLTLNALSGKGLDARAMREVAREAVDGVQAGLGRHGAQARAVLDQAYAGLDAAFAGAAEAASLTVKQALGNAGEFARTDVERLMSDLQGMEALYLEVLKEAGKKGGTFAADTVKEFGKHARRSGTAVGQQVKSSLDELAPLVRLAGSQLQESGSITAQAGGLMARAASGFLAAIADRLESGATSAQARGQGRQ